MDHERSVDRDEGAGNGQHPSNRVGQEGSKLVEDAARWEQAADDVVQAVHPDTFQTVVLCGGDDAVSVMKRISRGARDGAVEGSFRAGR
ncbi:hypothetical protein D3273_01115 [Lichenibacterium minor]|uniref:Uncharacterized protein n=1 Tax=Lichenibacterium minor TaxID=2316528 RepID=A0A4Q2UAP6_9HYPH|nr:hypothetical protein [Lichenibacterium minor]RYC33883.1 hypothetical protein D3273_01115 [Lichenibacterium minor]